MDRLTTRWIALALLTVAILRWIGPQTSPPVTRASIGAIEVLGAPDSDDDADGVEARAVAFVDGARQSLHAALYELGLNSLALALRRARDRGVDVRLFIEDDNRREKRERDCLGLLGDVPVHGDGRPTLMHDKFMVVDSQSVWTGSLNLTITGCRLHYNESVIVHDRRLAARYDAQFERLFDGRPDAEDGTPISIGDAAVNCSFARGTARLRPWLAAVRRARHRIEVAAFSLTEADLVAALAARARAGLAVDVILDARLVRGAPGRRAAAVLRAAGCTLHAGGPRPSRALLARLGLSSSQDIKIHHKLLVVDGRDVVTGSANLSANGMAHNDENVLSLQGSAAIGAMYERLLERARAASHPLEI